MTLIELKNSAKQLGIKKYSRMRKQELLDAIAYIRKTVTVYKGDLAITRKLGASYLRTLPVVHWEQSWKYYRPRSWSVPQSVLDEHGLVPLSSSEVANKTIKRTEKAASTRYTRLCMVADRIGAEPDGRLVRAVAAGRVDPDFAELIAFKAMYRHQHTDYDQLLNFGHERDDARSWLEEDAVPTTWENYLQEYGFNSKEAEAMASVLQDPQKCHPCWFKEAEIAIRGLDLSALTYERIQSAVMHWRYSREVD
jgi:hypothetical protein